MYYLYNHLAYLFILAPFSRDKFYCRQGSTKYDKKFCRSLSSSPFYSSQKIQNWWTLSWLKYRG